MRVLSTRASVMEGIADDEDLLAHHRKRFMKTISEQPGGCMVRVGSHIDKGGYSEFSLNRVGVHVAAHRFAYLLEYGRFDWSLFVCHRCDNRPCVNPAHLFLGTTIENSSDRQAKGRSVCGERIKSAALTADAVRSILHDARPRREIAAEHGVSVPTVRDVQLRLTWAHIDPHVSARQPKRITAELAREIRADPRLARRIARAKGLPARDVYRIKNGTWKPDLP